MQSSAKRAALDAAWAALIAESPDGGLTLTLLDVCRRANVSRATAFRGEDRFSDVFRKRKLGLGAPVDAEPTEPETTVSALRKINASLANEVQALALTVKRQDARIQELERAAPSVVRTFPFRGRRQVGT